MLITNSDSSTSFRNIFEDNLNNSNLVRIASGYFGASEVSKYTDQLFNIADTGGTVQLIHGMGGVEGIKKVLYDNLLTLDDRLKSTNLENRVYIHKNRYHGKMYITGNEKNQKTLIGSSNFSKAGFSKNLEMNYCHVDKEVCIEANLFFDYLKNESVPITDIELPKDVKLKPKLVEADLRNKEIFKNHPDYRLPVRITNASNLNLFRSAGRVDSMGIYTPRPFYEVELTILKKDTPPLTHYLPNQTGPAVFQAITDLGTTFEVNFKRKTSGGGSTQTLHETGLDFMSSPRIELGRYIKGKLMKKGLLSFGEPVTEDILIEYGKNTLDMYFSDNGKLYIKF